MSTQLARGCPKSDCGDVLSGGVVRLEYTRFVIKEDASEYSNWTASVTMTPILVRLLVVNRSLV